ncbi:hypothetical protein BVI2075_580037 [Burkholderia vietnamiensis]|nr:hypothetical protein BVI2075_580037 [Burkholderia vietnamiensis]
MAGRISIFGSINSITGAGLTVNPEFGHYQPRGYTSSWMGSQYKSMAWLFQGGWRSEQSHS